jgi:hypothetical protein
MWAFDTKGLGIILTVIVLVIFLAGWGFGSFVHFLSQHLSFHWS